MTKTVRTLLLLLLVATSGRGQINDGGRYASNSVLSQGKWIKISVGRSGIYSLSHEDILSLGLNPSGVKVYGYGGALIDEDFTKPYIDDLPEVPIYIHKGEDGVFNSGDYILFYAQANILWSYDTQKKFFTHTRNCYSDNGYYFITSSHKPAKQIEALPLETATSSVDITTFTDYMLHEQDLINLANGGREFYGEEFNRQTHTHSFSFYSNNVTNKNVKALMVFANKSLSAANMKVNLNGVDIKNITLKAKIDNAYQMADITQDTVVFTPSSNSFLFNLTLSNSFESAYLNYIEINLQRELQIDNNEFYFRYVDSIGKDKSSRFVLRNASASTQVWNITDINNIKSLNTTLNASQISFVANTNTLRQFLAINPNASFPKPNIVGEIPNQNLHSEPQTDMVVITHEDFISQANTLANYHRQKDEIGVAVVGQNAIFNEFSSGTPDASAYRRFVKMFFDRGENGGKKPKWLLLFGDGIYDNRGLMSGSNEFRKLLTYQAVNSINGVSAYTSDDYFGYLDDNDQAMNYNAQMDIGVGRLPVYTQEQANTAVDKTISYMDNLIRGEWKNRMLFVADDGDDNIHMRDGNMVAEETQSKNNDILVKKLYLDAYKQETSASTETYPVAEAAFDNYIKQGVLMINYMGHGSHISWANEKLLTTAKITSMINEKYPIFVTGTCDFSSFDQFSSSGGEQLLWNKTGGSMALITTTRTVLSGANAELCKYLSDFMFVKNSKGYPISIGETLTMAKNAQRDNNKFSFALLGDPALRLLYPYQAKIITDSINYHAVNNLLFDTISALSEVTIAGYIKTQYGDVIEGYNGMLYVNVFDKLEQMQTLANDKGSKPFVYKDRPNPIFKGTAAIENGRWKVKFFVPKDIKYNFGTGRIVYYATENNLGMEANGSFEGFIVGGENHNPPIDNEGPVVELYLNSQKFKEGQRVNSSPLFIADVYDQSGINTTGNGIGHDIILKKDRDKKEEIILNDYYTSGFGDYKSGKIEYQLDNLSEGKYNMWFRIWDLQNNSTTKTIAFEVSNKTKIETTITAYPNPATDFVTFLIEHDRPYKALDIKVRVFDISGRIMWVSPIEKVTNSNSTKIQWNFAQEGLKISKGIYFVQVEIGAKKEKTVFKPLKLIIN